MQFLVFDTIIQAVVYATWTRVAPRITQSQYTLTWEYQRSLK